MRIERHHSGVWVREDGCVYLPQSGKHPAHWTYGCKNRNGYLQVGIRSKMHQVHRLVAETFIPNPENNPEIDHINRTKTDNRVENLRWVTHSENNRNRRDNDRVDFRNGTHKYEDAKQYMKEYWGAKRKNTHKKVLFSDGKEHWVTNEKALELRKLPVKKRHYGNG